LPKPVQAVECPVRVIRDQFGMFAQSTLYPQHRTSAKRVGTSVSCQKRKWSDARLRQCLAWRQPLRSVPAAHIV